MNVPAYNLGGVSYGTIQTPSECLSSYGSSGYAGVSSVLVPFGFTVVNTNASIPNTVAPIAINFFDPDKNNWRVPNFVSSVS